MYPSNCSTSPGICRRAHTLNLNLRHSRTTQIRRPRLRVLLVKILDRTFDRVFRQHRAMQLHWRQTQLLRDLSVSDPASLLKRHAADELGQVGAGGDGGPAAEGLEFDVGDGLGIGVDADLEFHDVAAGGGADKACPRDVSSSVEDELWVWDKVGYIEGGRVCIKVSTNGQSIPVPTSTSPLGIEPTLRGFS